ncbi:hypothetical protein BT63DRAFT_469451 [Microthyrium microscopicum]|uniref:BTB domain-containing protein n=1 Tax=Microthyrium microscopicum TaxID=703497 RepID=A0A6A6UE47_9PEZI|nr:hypothetical protein BT63DRAFT_469451 [Microthyrium microscopicum]
MTGTGSPSPAKLESVHGNAHWEQLKKILKSDIQIFIVGQSQTPYDIHTEALTGLSPEIKTLVSENAEDNVVKWCWMPEEDFLRLVSYGYSGDFDCPPTKFTTKGIKTSPTRKGTPSATLTAASPSRSASVRSPNKSSPTGQTVQSLPIVSVTAGPASSKIDMSVVSSYARLYFFACKHNITALKYLTAYKIETILMARQIKAKDANGIKELLGFMMYVFQETTAEAEQLLRKIAMRYMGNNITVVANSPQFAEAMVKGGEFARAFWIEFQPHVVRAQSDT